MINTDGVLYCPNCGAQGERHGVNRVFCPACDAVFVIKEDGARVQATGKLQEIEHRLDALEGKTAPEAQEPPAILDPKNEPETPKETTPPESELPGF